MPDLPAGTDVDATAAYIADVLANKRPAPMPIAPQVAHATRLARQQRCACAHTARTASYTGLCSSLTSPSSAGAAGLFCRVAGQLGLKVLVLDHADKVAEKIRISGGGRCNFTNRDTGAANFLSDNPRFCRSALSRYSPRDFTGLLDRHRIAYHEKHKASCFADHSADDIIQMLLAECASGNVSRWQPCAVRSIRFRLPAPVFIGQSSYEIDSNQGNLVAAR